ncbi:cobyric acid synthase [Oceanicella actignis]|uniref:cobyric acid synthase n=1 Tax=Oceanicella actignis TaxID=1189325 RepID=UPI0011E7F058|nr:cobyric acid synthase [Oceanicella actignis]TYO88449.1 adenosylcobyric acid synthase (glutamine-hydrolysing) [Oceanicella actignis]
MTATLMIQGCGSNVGKSALTAGLARLFARRGLRVRPFKPQNMSNNAAVTADGGEIGRAQALQARAAGVAPSVHMNPVLLKPETDRGAQVILRGRRLTTAQARDYHRLKPQLMEAVLDSFARLRAEADLVLVEGAGSPAEVNLRAGDIANMGFARAAHVPVALVGDIDRGGVIAQIVGTQAVLDPADAALIRGFIVNKFRGDPALFEDGLRLIEQRTGWRSFGVAPWFPDAHRLPAEDAADLTRARAADAPDGAGRDGAAAPARPPVRIACPLISRIANFDDLDPLRLDPAVRLEMIPPGRALPGDADLVILPGAKSTRGDLDFIRAQGWDVDILAHWRRGGRVLGICGGYQMLGRSVADPDGVEGPPGETPGLGLLDVTTVMRPDKRLTLARGRCALTGEAVEGYEIHIGVTEGPDRVRPVFELDGRAEGASSPDGRVRGSYLHGMFAADGFRAAFLRMLGAAPAHDSAPGYEAQIDRTLDALADHLEASLDVDGLLEVARAGV